MTADDRWWKDRLRGAGDQYAALVGRIEMWVSEMNAWELEKTLKATEQPTQTNCGWGIYYAAPLARDAVRSEQLRRFRAAEAALHARKQGPA